MAQRLIVDVVKCTECRACELKCSYGHFGVFNPRKSGVRIVSNWPELAQARVCIQCDDPEACPYDGIWMDPLSGLAVKCDTCDGRFECVPVCFAGALCRDRS